VTNYRTYKFKDDTWWDEGTEVECYNSIDHLIGIGSQYSEVDCYSEAIYHYLVHEVTDPLVYHDIMNLLGIDVEIVDGEY